MSDQQDISEFLYKHLKSIFDNDIATYHETTSEDLTLYEWFVTPHRIDGLPFHDFMIESNASHGTVFGAGADPEESKTKKTRFDLSNLTIQIYGETAIASYTLLVSTNLSTGVQVNAHNESRVLVKIDDSWKVVHCHKSPAWKAPHTQD
jgi:hypothetical protein